LELVWFKFGPLVKWLLHSLWLWHRPSSDIGRISVIVVVHHRRRPIQWFIREGLSLRNVVFTCGFVWIWDSEMVALTNTEKPRIEVELIDRCKKHLDIGSFMVDSNIDFVSLSFYYYCCCCYYFYSTLTSASLLLACTTVVVVVLVWTLVFVQWV
jgi:hypothetical protein